MTTPAECNSASDYSPSTAICGRASTAATAPGITSAQGACRPLRFGYSNHVAFVADGKVLRLYRGGVQVASTPCDGVASPPPIKHLTIGCKNWSNSPDLPKLKPVQFWEGRIDELAIFNRTLSAGEIRRLFRCSPGESQSEVSIEKK